MKFTTKSLVRIGAIAAIYVCLCLVFQPISYGAVQVRISEALTILPVFSFDSIIGLTIGCFISNTLSFNFLDMLFGTLATLLSAISTYYLRNVFTKGLPIVATIPPVIFNAVIIGAEITFLFMQDQASINLLLFNILTVGAGQLFSCVFAGLLLYKVINKRPFLKNLFE